MGASMSELIVQARVEEGNRHGDTYLTLYSCCAVCTIALYRLL